MLPEDVEEVLGENDACLLEPRDEFGDLIE